MTTLLSTGGRRGPAPGTVSPQQAVATATASWTADGAAMPEWVLVLAEACDRASQTQLARQLGLSSSVVSGTINRNYKGSYDGIEARVRGALMAEVLACPVLGDIRKDHCLDHQKRALRFAATSTLRVQMYKACRGGCLHSRLARTIGVSS